MNILTKILRAIGMIVLDFIETMVMALSIFVIIYLLAFQPHQVKGNSMYPSLEDNEYLLTNKIGYRFNDPLRGDIVVFKAPHKEKFDYIKRIVGVPGDRVVLRNGKFYINKKLLEEGSYLFGISTSSGAFLSEDNEIVVPQESYFVLGDNRGHSSDSRDWGFVPRKNIIGKAWLRYWPPGKIGVVPKPTYANN